MCRIACDEVGMIRVPHVHSAQPLEQLELQHPPPSDQQDDAYKQQRTDMISAGAAQGCAELLVTQSCMMRVPHVRSTWPP
jgi:hypothetical protein